MYFETLTEAAEYALANGGFVCHNGGAYADVMPYWVGEPAWIELPHGYVVLETV